MDEKGQLVLLTKFCQNKSFAVFRSTRCGGIVDTLRDTVHTRPIEKDGNAVSTRKSDLPLPVRTPTYVSREVGAAELCISPETWDAMVARGELPTPDHKIGGVMPRWKWSRVEDWLSMKAERALVVRDPYVVGAEGVDAQAQE